MTEQQFEGLVENKKLEAVLLPGGWVDITGKASLGYEESDPKRQHLLTYKADDGATVCILLDAILGVRTK